MDVIKFTLSGETAFFKNPEVNAYYYFTYGCIHKISLLGIFGAICGYGGYNQQLASEEEFPEFYRKLKDIKIGIVPKNEKGYIAKKIQIYNNSVGYASKEQGGNLIVKEQWLENPKWDIYIQVSEETKELSKRLIHKNFVYIPYLGKNDHFADIMDVEMIENVEKDEIDYIDSIFLNKNIKVKKEDGLFDFDCDDKLFKYEEMLPITLNSTTNNYELETFIFTNNRIKAEEKDNDNILLCNEKTIFFF